VSDAVRAKPDLIAASSTPIVAALKQATQTIPIVFVIGNDPVGQGFVGNLARPGGNLTGFSFIDFPLIGKWLELLKEIAPDTRRITFMFNPQTAPYYPVFLREFGASSAALAAELSATPVHDQSGIEAAVTRRRSGTNWTRRQSQSPWQKPHWHQSFPRRGRRETPRVVARVGPWREVRNPTNPVFAESETREVEAAARSLSIKVVSGAGRKAQWLVEN
jgi:hypothetical protein